LRLAAEFPSITYGEAPPRRPDEWSWVVQRLRLGLDYLRYQHPVFETAWKLRERSRERTPVRVRAHGGMRPSAGRVVAASPDASLRADGTRGAEDPCHPRLPRSAAPDSLLLTPLVDLASSQIEYLRAARALRVPTAVCVELGSPVEQSVDSRHADRVFVWNDTQKLEAMNAARRAA
jgi:hypothetical protein